MSTATKNYGSVSLTSSYIAFTDDFGYRGTYDANEANSGAFAADLATLGIPAGSTINLATFTYTIVTPSLHGYEKRQLMSGSTVVDTWFDSGDTPNLSSIASFFLRFKTAKNNTTYPSPGGSPITNQSVWAISDLTLTVDYTAPGGTPPSTTNCTAPTWVVVTESAAPGAAAYLAWGGAQSGIGNPIVGYAVYQQLNSGAFEYIGVNTLEGFPVTAPETIGHWHYYKIKTIGTNGIYSDFSPVSNVLLAELTAPSVSNVRLAGSASDQYKGASEEISLTWDAAGGTNNPISSYTVQRSLNGGSYAAWSGSTGLTAKSLAVAAHATPGNYYTYRVMAVGAHSNSAYSASPKLYTIGACTAPSSAGLSASVSEGDVTLSYAGAAAGAYNAITGYEIQYAESANGSTWGAWTALKTVSNSGTSGTTSAAVSSTRGNYRKYRIRTQGSAGASFYSAWRETSAVRRNSAPAAPSVTAPAAGTTIYNSTPRILATVGADADSNTQTVAATGYTASSAGNQAVGKKLVLRRTNAYSAGSQSVSVASTDSFGVGSSAVSRSFTYAAPSWTDGTLTGGTTKIKAAHMNELRAAVNNVRAYYGMAAVSWAQAITAGSTSLGGWKDHVLELRAAIDAIVTLVNGWDAASSTHNIPAISWLAIPTNKPTKAVMDQLRAVIPTL